MNMRTLPYFRQRSSRAGFTLVEALVVAGIVGVLASLIVPAVSNAKGKGYAVVCLNNMRQLALAWNVYAEDRDGYLPYNYGISDTYLTITNGQLLNWANNVMTWGLEDDNTNEVLLAQGGLGPYLGGAVTPFKCPSDRVLSVAQRGAGWAQRTRTYSMNAMVGYAGGYMKFGTNINNPKFKQFTKLNEIPDPSAIFVFIEEHPQSINDGYFLNKPNALPPHWYDLPAAYHNGGANLSFADGHIEYRKWLSMGTIYPHVERGVTLPVAVPLDDTRDYDWLMERMGVER
jgi:prepilin-type processing-associated H-X9-DG protein